MKVLFAIVTSLLTGTANAAWIVTTSRVVNVAMYAHTDSVLVQLESAGTAAGCADASVFAIDGGMQVDRRKQLVAALLSAQARGASVAVSYENAGGCISWDGSPNVFRAIARASVQ